MRAGTLRDYVKIERPATEVDAYGMSAAPVWSLLRESLAAVRPLRASEIVRAAQAGMETAYIVSMRYQSDITADCRLIWREKTLHITSLVNVDGRDRELEIACTEREAG